MTSGAAALALLLLASHPAGAARDEPATPPGPPGGGRDEIVRAAFVPSEDQPQGEVRLIRRGHAAVMQTVLYSRYLKRVVAEIRKKELASWPPSREGHDDARRYIEAVLAARELVQRRFGERADRGDRRQNMLIEFILSGTASRVTISEPELEEANGRMRVVARHPIATLELSRTYVRGDFYEIARDALKLGRREARDILEPLLPPESPASAMPSGEGEGGSER